MFPRSFAFAVTALFSCTTAMSALAPEPVSPAPVRSIGVPLHVFGGRTADQSASLGGAKLDSALGAVVRRLPTVRVEHAVEDLRALNPAMRFMQPPGSAEPLVLVDAVTRGDPNQMKATLVALGLQRPAQYLNDVGGWLPVSQLRTASLQSEVHSIRAAMPRRRSGAVNTQGDFVLHADQVRNENALDGNGITVGIISDSYNCYAHYSAEGLQAGGNDGYANNGFTATASSDINTGDLPPASKIKILEDASCDAYSKTLQLPFGDEGRAMMQIVHDVAPGAAVAFYTAENSEADFAAGIVKLASTAGGGAGARIIVDDVGYFNEPFFQDGLVGQAISSVVAAGSVYFSAAGNNGETAYDSASPSFSVPGTGSNAGETLLTFDSTHGTTLPLTIPALSPGEFIAVVVEWDQPYVTGAANSGGSTSQIDLCLNAAGSGSDLIINDSGQTLAGACTGASTLHQDPVQLALIGNPANASGATSAETLNIVVGLKAGGNLPGRLKVAVEANGANITLPATAPTMQGHPNTPAAIAVGAARYYHTPACGESLVRMEPYSSRGGDPQLFDASGARLPTPVARTKPDLVGPDGGNDTFLGFQDTKAPVATGSCKNNTGYPNFLGTSAAAPHIAAVAALLLQADPSLTPGEVRGALVAGAIATDKPADFQGAGFVQASDAATRIPAIVPAAPALALSAATITLGASSTLSWSSANNQGCTASGGWTGAQPPTGSRLVSPSAAGTTTYVLACTNFAGTSPASSVKLTVTAAMPAASGGGGGGSSGGVPLLVLAALAWVARARRADRIR